MRRILAFVLVLSVVFTAAACGTAQKGSEPSGGEDKNSLSTAGAGNENTEEQDIKYARIPMVMVEGSMYYDTGRESDLTGRCGVMDGKITSTVEGWEIPTEDDQSNFGSGYEYQWGEAGTIEIYMNEKWIVFEKRGGDGSTVVYNGERYDRSELSEETLQWLDWYNSLTEEGKQAVDSVPAEFTGGYAENENSKG